MGERENYKLVYARVPGGMSDHQRTTSVLTLKRVTLQVQVHVRIADLVSHHN